MCRSSHTSALVVRGREDTEEGVCFQACLGEFVCAPARSDDARATKEGGAGAVDESASQSDIESSAPIEPHPAERASVPSTIDPERALPSTNPLHRP